MPEFSRIDIATQVRESQPASPLPQSGGELLEAVERGRSSVSPHWAASLAAVDVIPASRSTFAKRAFDIVFALIVLLFTLPLYPFILLAIRLDSPGPALFRQTRVGRHGHLFTVYKFRSMHFSPQQTVDPLYHTIAASWIAGVPIAESVSTIDTSTGGQTVDGAERTRVQVPTGTSAKAEKASGGSHYKLANDPRITRVGRFLRATSMDELPQFINVLLGDMSVVGPRPAIPYEVDHYSTQDFGRMLVKPGVTGLWQVKGRGRVTFQQMIELDLEYVAHNSFWQDVSLILRTVPAVVLRTGAA